MLRWLIFGLIIDEAFTALVAQLHGGGQVGALLAGLAWWALVAMVLVGGAALLNRPDGSRVDVLGIPNGLTALRAWACLPLALCALWTLPHNLGFILWCTVGGSVGMLDLVDGYVARRFGPITALGKAIDPAMDSLFFSLGALGSVLLGILPVWMGWLIVIRYLGPLLLTPIVFLARRRPELVHTTWGRRNTAAIGLIIFICMWVRIFNGPVGLVAAVVGLPLFVPTAVLHFRDLVDRVTRAPMVR
jgi:CDP-diacylglycerol--glycerol-3-phosphate 3-phosphatidyltransferase